MGRKIPGRKHRGVRDPEVQRINKEAPIKKKLNAAPINPDEQEMPRKLLMIAESKKRMLEDRSRRPKNRKKNVASRDLLDSAKNMGYEIYQEGMKPLKPIPRFRQDSGESKKKFFNRVQRTVDNMLKCKSYEDHFGVELIEDFETGKTTVKKAEKDELELEAEEKKRKAKMKKLGIVLKTKEEKRKIKNEIRKKQRAKNKKKSQLMDVDGLDEDAIQRHLRFEGLKDKIAFNETVHAPPKLNFVHNKSSGALNFEERKPASKDGLILQKMLLKDKDVPTLKQTTKTVSLAKRKMLENERIRVVEQYRMIKKMNNQKK